MTEQLLTFMRLLRTQGLPISVAESLDALRSVTRVGLHDRELLRLTLRTALVKSPQYFPVFDTLFDRFFTVSRPRKRRRKPHGSATGEGQRAKHQGNGQIRQPAVPLRLSPSSLPHPSPRIPLQDQIHAAAQAGLMQAHETVARLRQAWQEQLRLPQRQERWSPHDPGVSRLHRRLDRPFPATELADMYREVERLASRLLARHALRYRRARHGRLDLRRTVLQGLRSSQEVSFTLAYRRRKISKLRLIVLCDVSGSVWQVSTFLLKLVHTLQTAFTAVRSLVFVDTVVDVTELFRHLRFPEDLERLRRHPHLNLFGLSDFGRVFYQFFRDYAHFVNRETVVLILGDARNNAFDPQAWALEEVQRRCHCLIWLNPEPRAQWNRGDSVIDAYAPYCHIVLECWTLAHLLHAAEALLHLPLSPMLPRMS